MYTCCVGNSAPSVPELLKRKRVLLGLSARSVSVAAGQSPSYMSKLEADLIEPSLRSFARVAKVLQLTPAEVASVLSRYHE